MPSKLTAHALAQAVQDAVPAWANLVSNKNWSDRDSSNVFSRVSFAARGEDLQCVFGTLDEVDLRETGSSHMSWTGQLNFFTTSRVIVAAKGPSDTQANIFARSRSSLIEVKVTRAIEAAEGHGKLAFSAIYSWGLIDYQALSAAYLIANKNVEAFFGSLVGDLSN